MKNSETANAGIITESYRVNSSRVLQFVASRVNSVEDAKNIAQDVWLRLLTYAKPISPETLTSLIFVVARNLINDYFRRACHSQAISDEWTYSNSEVFEDSPEQLFSAKQIAELEDKMVECLPDQRRTIYKMCRFGEKTTEEIARRLSLSKRTVENHLRLGRRDVRNYMAACV